MSRNSQGEQQTVIRHDERVEMRLSRAGRHQAGGLSSRYPRTACGAALRHNGRSCLLWHWRCGLSWLRAAEASPGLSGIHGGRRPRARNPLGAGLPSQVTSSCISMAFHWCYKRRLEIRLVRDPVETCMGSRGVPCHARTCQGSCAAASRTSPTAARLRTGPARNRSASELASVTSRVAAFSAPSFAGDCCAGGEFREDSCAARGAPGPGSRRQSPSSAALSRRHAARRSPSSCSKLHVRCQYGGCVQHNSSSW